MRSSQMNNYYKMQKNVFQLHYVYNSKVQYKNDTIKNIKHIPAALNIMLRCVETEEVLFVFTCCV